LPTCPILETFLAFSDGTGERAAYLIQLVFWA